MNVITKKHISRRTLLRGAGVAMALPILDAMKPALAAPTSAAAAAVKQPVRMAFTYLPNGVTLKEWTPAAEGANFEFTRILKPLEPFRNDLFVLSGLDCHNGNSLGDGGGDHARAGAAYLTGVHPKKTAGSDIHGGISVDQIAAQSVGAKTRLASLELGCEDSRTVGNCDTGYSCAYTNSVSWRTPTMPMPPETKPRVVFERLFGTDDLKVDPATRAKRTALRTSILDMVNDRAKRLMGDVGTADQRKLDEYMTGVRDVEKRIQMAQNDTHKFTPDIDKPEGVTHADCEFISQQVGTILDVEDVIPGARYVLEVSSPGVERKLSKPRDFERFVGQKVKIALRQPVENQRHFVGALKSFAEGVITLEDSPGHSVQFPLEQVERANLKFEW